MCRREGLRRCHRPEPWFDKNYRRSRKHSETTFRTGAVDGDTRRVYQDVGEGNGWRFRFRPEYDRDGGGSFLLQCGFRCAVTTTLARGARAPSADRVCEIVPGKDPEQITRHERFAPEMK